MSEREMTPEQDAALDDIRGEYGVREHRVHDDGSVRAVDGEGDSWLIAADGARWLQGVPAGVWIAGNQVPEQ